MTSLTRWRPFEEIDQFWPRDLFSRLLPQGGVAVEWNPRCDVTESDNEMIIHAELPGVAAEDMDVEVKDSVLTIKGEKRTETTEKKNGDNTYSERFFGSFQRSIAIPNVDADKIEADLKDGVLEVRLPKVTPPEPAPKKVTIKAKS